MPDAGEPDAGACHDTWVLDPDFECGAEGWLVPEGAGQVVDGGLDGGGHSYQLIANAQAVARLALATPVKSDVAVCASVWVRGTASLARLEIQVDPLSQVEAFSTPVFSTWSVVPPRPLRVALPRDNQAWLSVRMLTPQPGQVLEVDGVSFEPCP